MMTVLEPLIDSIGLNWHMVTGQGQLTVARLRHGK